MDNDEDTIFKYKTQTFLTYRRFNKVRRINMKR